MRACMVALSAFLLCAAAFGVQVQSTPVVHAAALGGINVEPSARPWRYVGANPDSWWCPIGACTTSDPLGRINTELSLAHQLNVANVRLEIPWFLVEPSRGGYSWSRADYIFQSAAAYGVTIQPILVYTPAWDGGYNAFPVAADFQAFVTTFMGRYGSRIRAVEMWNEPDGGQSLVSNNPSLYVQDILKPGYTAVKSVRPGVSVIEGGSINDSGTCCAWLSGVISAGGGSYFDIAAFHDYGGNYAQVVSAYRSLVGGKPIWLGEYGVSDATGSQQSSLITAAIAGTPGLAMAQFYTLRDESVYLCCPPTPYGEHKLYGVVAADDVTKKSSFYTMQRLLGGSSPPPPPAKTPPAAAKSPTPSPSPSPSPSATPHGQPSSSSPHAGATPTASSLPSAIATAPGKVRALIRSIVPRGSTRVLSYVLFALGLVTFGWGGLRATNIAALTSARPRPPLLKPRSNLNIAILLGGGVLCIAAILLLVYELSSRI